MRVFCSFVAQLMLLLPATVGAAAAAAASCAGFVSRSQYSVVRASSRTINADASAASEQSSDSSPRLVSSCLSTHALSRFVFDVRRSRVCVCVADGQ